MLQKPEVCHQIREEVGRPPQPPSLLCLNLLFMPLAKGLTTWSLGNHGNGLTCSLDQFITEVLKLELELVQIKPEKSKGPEKGETSGSRGWDMEQG